jgi:hypothetical protein
MSYLVDRKLYTLRVNPVKFRLTETKEGTRWCGKIQLLIGDKVVSERIA